MSSSAGGPKAREAEKKAQLPRRQAVEKAEGERWVGCRVMPAPRAMGLELKGLATGERSAGL